jgi:hypothetical protein
MSWKQDWPTALSFEKLNSYNICRLVNMHSNVRALKFKPIQTIFSYPLKQSTNQSINQYSNSLWSFSAHNHIKKNGLLNICMLHDKAQKYCHKICRLFKKVSTLHPTWLSRRTQSARWSSFGKTGVVHQITYSFCYFFFTCCFIYPIYSWKIKQTKSYFIKLTKSLVLPHSHRSRKQLTSLTDCCRPLSAANIFSI